MKLSLRPSVNWLFVFVSITVALEHIRGLPAPVVFFAAALAIVPIASLLVHATEQIATRTGDATIGSWRFAVGRKVTSVHNVAQRLEKLIEETDGSRGSSAEQ